MDNQTIRKNILIATAVAVVLVVMFPPSGHKGFDFILFSNLGRVSVGFMLMEFLAIFILASLAWIYFNVQAEELNNKVENKNLSRKERIERIMERKLQAVFDGASDAELEFDSEISGPTGKLVDYNKSIKENYDIGYEFVASYGYGMGVNWD